MKARLTPTRPGQWEYRDGLLVDVATGTPYEKQIVNGVVVDYAPPKPAQKQSKRTTDQEKVA